MNELNATIYGSPKMLERRRRVLEETRRLLEERGFDDFSVRELCERPKSAPRTFFHVFGSKDRVIAQSVFNVVRDNGIDGEEGLGDPTTMEGLMSRLVASAAGSMRLRVYAAAVMSVYAAVPGFPEIRVALREACYTFVRPYLDHLQSMGGLAPEVAAAPLERLIKTNLFATISDWCVGELDDDQFVDRYAENLLALLMSANRGYVAMEAEHWLRLVRTGDRAWIELREAALKRRAVA